MWIAGVGRPVPVKPPRCRVYADTSPTPPFAPEPGDGPMLQRISRSAVVPLFKYWRAASKALHEERRLHEVTPVVVLAKVGNYFAGAPIQKMRPLHGDASHPRKF